MVRGEIAVRLLDQQQIAILPDVAQIGELVLVVALALDLGGVAIELARLADQVEAHIGERHILFQHRRVAAPFRQPVPEDQARRRRGAARRAPAAFRRPDVGIAIAINSLAWPSLRGAKRRSNPDFLCGAMDCFASLAMTKITYARLRPALRRTSDAGRSSTLPARTSCPFRTGSEAVIALDGTTQIDRPSPRRV